MRFVLFQPPWFQVTRHICSHATPVRSRGHYPIAEAFTDKATLQADSYGQAMLQAESYRLIRHSYQFIQAGYALGYTSCGLHRLIGSCTDSYRQAVPHTSSYQQAVPHVVRIVSTALVSSQASHLRSHSTRTATLLP